ncbi:MAG: TPM domain-containing protein [Blastocatellia bacterium]|nr:TPM domain-containing protein [Blastocatellia bacterium]
MTRRKLLRSLNCARIKEAIQQAEQRTSGEICVSIASLFWGSAEKAAERAFARLGMTQTKQRNGVLLFVVPARRKLIVVGDHGIHEKVGPEFWQRIVAVVTEQFRTNDFTEGLVRGIAEIGAQLSLHFPDNATSGVNELPDEIDFGARQPVEK